MLKRALAATLCLIMVFALLPKTARAGSENRSLRYDSGNSTLYLGEKEAPGCGSVWFGENNTLYLKNGFSFKTSANTVLRMPGSSQLIIENGCKLESTCSSGVSYGIYCEGSLSLNGNLTVICGSTTNDSYGVYVQFGELGLASSSSLTATGGSTTGGNSYGVYVGSEDHLGLSPDATLTATGGKAKNGNSYGAFAGRVSANENSTLSGTGGEAGVDSYGVFATGDITTFADDASIMGTGSQATTLSSYGVYSENGDITARGGSITGTGGASVINTSFGVFAGTGKVAAEGGNITGIGVQGGSNNSRGVYTKRLDVSSGQVVGESAEGGKGLVKAAFTPPQGTYYWRLSKTGPYEASTSTPLPADLSAETYVDIRSDQPTIEITTSPDANTTVKEGSITGSLRAAASTSFGGNVTLNWYACDEDSAISGNPLGTGGTFPIPTDLTAGTYYYLCQATCPGAVTANSNVAKVTVSTPGGYEITKGQHGQWLKGSGVGLGFTANGDYSKFTGVSVDGMEIANSNYTSQSGSTIVTLNAAYMETLTPGWHTLRINFTDGYAETNFFIAVAGGAGGDVGPDVPQTGDAATPVLWLWLMLLAGAGLIVRRKRRNG